MISVNMVNISCILLEQYKKIAVLSYGLSWKSKVILGQKYGITIIVPTSGVIRLCFILLAKLTVIKDE